MKLEGGNYPTAAALILKVILEKSLLTFRKESYNLERLALIDAGTTVDLPSWKHPHGFADFLVRFTAQMTHLTCCCLSFKQIQADFNNMGQEFKPNLIIMLT